MSPSLPPGVHTRTLRVVESILDRVGHPNIGEVFPLFLPALHGAYPKFSTAVRAICLEILTDHVVPSLSRLESCLSCKSSPEITDRLSADKQYHHYC